MKSMNRFLAAALALLMLLSGCAAAMAEEPVKYAITECGITFTWPEGMNELAGIVEPYPQGQIIESPELNVWYLGFVYAAMDEETYAKLDDPQASEEDMAKLGWLASIYVADVEHEALVKALCEMSDVQPDDPMVQNIEEFGSAEGYHFYFQPENDAAYLAAIGADYADAFKKNQDAVLEAMKAAELYAPVVPGSDFPGQSFKFETTDLDGNPVTSDEIYANNKITMFNYWGTWCGPCVGELAELAGIDAQLRKMGCGVVGILQDAAKEGGIEAAKALIAENGIEYLNLVPSPGMGNILDAVSSFPTTFFVDATGTVVGKAIFGALPDRYIPTVEALLNGEPAPAEDEVNGEAVPAEEPAAAQTAEKAVYRVIVADADGNPVEGVAVQFCDDESCMFEMTDAEGAASFDMPEGDGYTVHILNVPDGFATDDTEYKVPDHHEDMHVTLKSAK